MKNYSRPAQAFIVLIAICGFAVLSYGLLFKPSADYFRFASFLVVASFASRLKLSLPRLNGSMSANLPFILIAVAELSLPEALFVACISTIVQSIRKSRPKFNVVQLMFNFCSMAIAVGFAHIAMNSRAVGSAVAESVLMLVLAGVVLFLANTIPVASIISLTEHRRVTKVWSDIFMWSFPFYVLSTGITSIVTRLDRYVGWQIPLFVLPLMIAVYHCYKRYFDQPASPVAARLMEEEQVLCER
jgi:riboflavin transporter FmnP